MTLPEDVVCLLDVVGLRPVLVDALGEDAYLDTEGGILFLDAALDVEDLTDVIDQALTLAASALRATGSA